MKRSIVQTFHDRQYSRQCTDLIIRQNHSDNITPNKWSNITCKNVKVSTTLRCMYDVYTQTCKFYGNESWTSATCESTCVQFLYRFFFSKNLSNYPSHVWLTAPYTESVIVNQQILLLVIAVISGPFIVCVCHNANACSQCAFPL